MSFQYENDDDDDGSGLYIALGSGIGFVVSFIATLGVIKCSDVFCSTEVSEEALARMIARLEQRDEGLLNKSKTIFANMSEDERRNVLEKVLLRKPYTDDVINEIKSERAASITEEGHARASLSVPLLGVPESIPVPSIPSSSSNQTEDHDTNLNQHTNINTNANNTNNTNSKNSTMWPLGLTRIFSNKDEDNNNNNNDDDNNKEEGENENDIQNEKDERTKIIDHEDEYIGDDQCAICMESYEVGTDVTIGKCCLHMFHTRCILKWMCAQHDFCPFCRKYLFDVGEFKDMVESELGAERFGELVQSDAPNLVEMYMNTNTNTDALITNGTENENENNNESDNESDNGRNNNSHDGTENMATEENNGNSSNDSAENINDSTETNTGVTDNTQ